MSSIRYTFSHTILLRPGLSKCDESIQLMIFRSLHYCYLVVVNIHLDINCKQGILTMLLKSKLAHNSGKKIFLFEDLSGRRRMLPLRLAWSKKIWARANFYNTQSIFRMKYFYSPFVHKMLTTKSYIYSYFLDQKDCKFYAWLNPYIIVVTYTFAF